MICQIADLIVEIPEAGDMVPRCREYLTSSCAKPDIVISRDTYRYDYWKNVDDNFVCYMESGRSFYGQLLRYGGMLLHASALEFEGKAYLFSGPSGVGKSTHTRLWQQTFGDAVQVFNDDKPALRFVDGQWFAYGTPWCGKDGINQNKKVPLAGICFMKQGLENKIRKLETKEAIALIMSQTLFRLTLAENMDFLLENLDKLVRRVPIYELENNASPESVQLTLGILHKA